MSVKSSLLAKKKGSLAKKPQVKPGWFVLKYDKVKKDTSYLDPVYLLKYTLVNKAGKEFSFEERFVDKPGYARTIEYFEYLDANGIEDIEDTVGLYEKVRIGWKFSEGKRLPSIDPSSREFISEAQFISREVLEDAEAV